MTEDEAKTKWCPQARIVTVHPDAGMIAGPGNRTEICGDDHFTKPMGSFCIGSACMAWRWRRWERTSEHGHTFEAYPHEDGAVAVDGFCGLAGAAS